jgi:hypothetical protein
MSTKEVNRQKILNPVTNRWVVIGGPTHKRLIRQGVLNNTLDIDSITVNTDAMNDRMAKLRAAKKVKNDISDKISDTKKHGKKKVVVSEEYSSSEESSLSDHSKQ